ncbi:RES family NAD+ phosphorylase [Azorhizobium sp. AG788]|uniref:RES family NAD+ phosphorylase n=1 Tax=Azorhizobium sp. AG788 TaxID=2183897 RepID=UPI003139F1B6
MTDRYSDAPKPSYRVIPSRFPPISVFDTVATASDLEAVMDLAGWTSDRLVADRLARLDRAEWVFGQPNSSIVMAAFLHVPPSGMRFNSPELGAWYAAADLDTAVVEVAHHLRREAVARSIETETRTYRVYTSVLEGSYLDIRGQRTGRSDLYDATSYAASQVFGEAIRSGGGNGLIYDSIRKVGGTNVVAYRPRTVTGIVQTLHLRITITAGSKRIEVERLSV